MPFTECDIATTDFFAANNECSRALISLVDGNYSAIVNLYDGNCPMQFNDYVTACSNDFGDEVNNIMLYSVYYYLLLMICINIIIL